MIVIRESTSALLASKFGILATIPSIVLSSFRVVLISMLTFLECFPKFPYTVLDIELLHLSNEASNLPETDLEWRDFCTVGHLD